MLGLDVLDNTIRKELNECFLLHGTATSSVDAIARLGFDLRLSRDSAVYGRGIYLAESIDKAFMYTGNIYCLRCVAVVGFYCHFYHTTLC